MGEKDSELGFATNLLELRIIKPLLFPDDSTTACFEINDGNIQRNVSTSQAYPSISFLPPIAVTKLPTYAVDGVVAVQLLLRCPLCMILLDGIPAFYHHLRTVKHSMLFPPGMTYVSVMCYLGVPPDMDESSHDDGSSAMKKNLSLRAPLSESLDLDELRRSS